MMKSIPVWKQELSDGVHAARLASLYCCSPAETASEAARYTAVLDGLEKTFGSHAEAGLYSAPGRTEIGGNHTDHQHGRVLAGSVNIDMIAAAAPNDKNQLRVQSEGYDLCVIDLNDLEARKEEENTTAALLRGECAAFTQRGAKLAGLDVYVSSNVPKGSGVSSSAAFEVLIGVILNDCFMTEKVSPIAIAQIGQWAENVYFGKPCGLLDQSGVACGGLNKIDFKTPDAPVVPPLPVPKGYSLVITNTGGSHSGLTQHYTAIREDMAAVAAFFGKKFLREVNESEFFRSFPSLKKRVSERAILRSVHFFEENARVDRAAEALKRSDMPAFLKCLKESGESSQKYLQNCFVPGSAVQPVSLALKLSEKILKQGGCRLHGGGFAGTVIACVSEAERENYTREMARIFGRENVFTASVRRMGTARVDV